MKIYRDVHFRAGFQYESAQSLYKTWLYSIQKAYKSFELVSVTKSTERESWQEISASYSVDSMEDENIDLMKKLVEATETIKRYEEMFDELLDEEKYKKWKENEIFMKGLYDRKEEGK